MLALAVSPARYSEAPRTSPVTTKSGRWGSSTRIWTVALLLASLDSATISVASTHARRKCVVNPRPAGSVQFALEFADALKGRATGTVQLPVRPTGPVELALSR